MWKSLIGGSIIYKANFLCVRQLVIHFYFYRSLSREIGIGKWSHDKINQMSFDFTCHRFTDKFALRQMKLCLKREEEENFLIHVPPASLIHNSMFHIYMKMPFIAEIRKLKRKQYEYIQLWHNAIQSLTYFLLLMIHLVHVK